MAQIDTKIYASMCRILRAGGQLEQVTATFCTNSRSRLEQLRKAIEQRNDSDLIGVAHALKGSCAMFGAKGCAEICQSIENIVTKNPQNKNYESLENLLENLTKELDQVFEFLQKQPNPETKDCCP